MNHLYIQHGPAIFSSEGVSIGSRFEPVFTDVLVGRN